VTDSAPDIVTDTVTDRGTDIVTDRTTDIAAGFKGWLFLGSGHLVGSAVLLTWEAAAGNVPCRLRYTVM